MSLNTPDIAVGHTVRLRKGSCIANARADRLHLRGIVVASEHLPGYGDGIKVQWPDEEHAWGFQHAGLFERVY